MEPQEVQDAGCEIMLSPQEPQRGQRDRQKDTVAAGGDFWGFSSNTQRAAKRSVLDMLTSVDRASEPTIDATAIERHENDDDRRVPDGNGGKNRKSSHQSVNDWGISNSDGFGDDGLLHPVARSNTTAATRTRGATFTAQHYSTPNYFVSEPAANKSNNENDHQATTPMEVGGPTAATPTFSLAKALRESTATTIPSALPAIAKRTIPAEAMRKKEEEEEDHSIQWNQLKNAQSPEPHPPPTMPQMDGERTGAPHHVVVGGVREETEEKKAHSIQPPSRPAPTFPPSATGPQQQTAHRGAQQHPSPARSLREGTQQPNTAVADAPSSATMMAAEAPPAGDSDNQSTKGYCCLHAAKAAELEAKAQELKQLEAQLAADAEAFASMFAARMKKLAEREERVSRAEKLQRHNNKQMM